eukprot:PhM_4_TR17508/c2_g1_i1/m.939
MRRCHRRCSIIDCGLRCPLLLYCSAAASYTYSPSSSSSPVPYFPFHPSKNSRTPTASFIDEVVLSPRRPTLADLDRISQSKGTYSQIKEQPRTPILHKRPAPRHRDDDDHEIRRARLGMLMRPPKNNNNNNKKEVEGRIRYCLFCARTDDGIVVSVVIVRGIGNAQTARISSPAEVRGGAAATRHCFEHLRGTQGRARQSTTPTTVTATVLF